MRLRKVKGFSGARGAPLSLSGSVAVADGEAVRRPASGPHAVCPRVATHPRPCAALPRGHRVSATPCLCARPGVPFLPCLWGHHGPMAINLVLGP